MRIGIIGAGRVGGRLGQRWAEGGHDIFYGVRDTSSDRAKVALANTPAAQIGSIEQAVAFGEVVVLAIRWPAIEDIIPGAGDWSGKILIDATNRFGLPPQGSSGSAGEDLARLAAGALVVKAFNTIGAEHYLNPQFGDQAASMFICGDDTRAKRMVAGLCEALGFEAVDCGPLTSARLLETLGELWVTLSRGDLGRDIAFKLLTR